MSNQKSTESEVLLTNTGERMGKATVYPFLTTDYPEDRYDPNTFLLNDISRLKKQEYEL